jgi:hypothetical protein
MSEDPLRGKRELTYGANELALRLILLVLTALRVGETWDIVAGAWSSRLPAAFHNRILFRLIPNWL